MVTSSCERWVVQTGADGLSNGGRLGRRWRIGGRWRGRGVGCERERVWHADFGIELGKPYRAFLKGYQRVSDAECVRALPTHAKKPRSKGIKAPCYPFRQSTPPSHAGGGTAGGAAAAAAARDGRCVHAQASAASGRKIHEAQHRHSRRPRPRPRHDAQRVRYYRPSVISSKSYGWPSNRTASSALQC